MVTVGDVRSLALSLPRTTEHLIRDRVKFRVGSLVYVAFSRDETIMGFAFPKEEREALLRSDPGRFSLPVASDLRYNWVLVHFQQLSRDELTELVIDAWRMVVPKRVAAEHLATRLRTVR
ncbi:MAG: MmcQ/YjbR family DNA-binding protein [Actinomycetota bacterium]|nr:MmcQ/YjbR family DNA-binding protein [Actinomycetota bacterium]